MKFLFIALVVMLGFQVHAEVPAHRVSTHKEFSIRSSTSPGESVYYNCDSVENAVTDLLSKLGARNISVWCTGGIQYDQPPMDAFVDVSFDALNLANINDTGIVMANWTPIKIHSWDDCELKTQIFNNTQSGFSMSNVRLASCLNSTSQFRASLTTLF
jgi:hypothetical protein